MGQDLGGHPMDKRFTEGQHYFSPRAYRIPVTWDAIEGGNEATTVLGVGSHHC